MIIDSLHRYPVKGLSSEVVPSIDVKAGRGFAFDREYAVTDGSFVFDESNPIARPKTHFLMLAHFERLALLKTKFDPDTRHLEISISDSLSKVFPLGSTGGRRALAEFLTKFLAAPLRGEAQVIQSKGQHFTNISVYSSALMQSISLINLTTVRDLGQYIGQHLDPRRFRANIYFDGAAPWSELDWVGKTIRAGNVLMKVVRRTQRCPATSVDLERGIRDINVPKSIYDYRGHSDCGIYAEILSAGTLKAGAKFSLISHSLEISDVFDPSQLADRIPDANEMSP